METRIDEAESLTRELAALLETIEAMEQKERPYLLARYQACLGVLEYRLLSLQVQCRAYVRRIELIQARLNHGRALSPAERAEIDREVDAELASWHARLAAQADTLAAGRAYLTGLTTVAMDVVARAKVAYRRLARCLHPDVAPENRTLFERYWPAVQDAYRMADADLLEALLHLVEQVSVREAGAEASDVARLLRLIEVQADRLARLKAEPPFCWAGQLNDEVWLAARQAALEEAVAAEADRLAGLAARHAALAASGVE